MDGYGGGVLDLRNKLQCVQGNNPRSISFMIQTTHTRNAVILATGGANFDAAFFVTLAFGGAASIIQIDVYYAGFYPSTVKVVTDGLWHTVLITYDGTRLSIYVDGILDNTATSWNSGSYSTISSTLNTAGNKVVLGQWADVGSRWIGKLKNVMFFDNVISISYALANNYQSAGSILYDSGNLLINLITDVY